MNVFFCWLKRSQYVLFGLFEAVKMMVVVLFILTALISVQKTVDGINILSPESSQIVVFDGPSAVGKGTVIKQLLETFPDHFGFSVSHTTRAIRPGEMNATHYNFVPVYEFVGLVNDNQFIEHAIVHNNYYGTSFKSVQLILSQGKICILDIASEGIENLRKSSCQFKAIFLSPPSMEELRRRLINRRTESDESIEVRMNNAVKAIAYSKVEGVYDKVIVNHDIESTFNAVLEALYTWFPTLPQRQ